MTKRPVIKTDDLGRLAARFKTSAKITASTDAGARGAAKPTVKTNIVFQRDVYARLLDTLRWRQQEAFRRGQKPPRGISELIDEALQLWFPTTKLPASHRSNP